MQFDEGFRADLIVNGLVIVELKSVERFAPLHAKHYCLSDALWPETWVAGQFWRGTNQRWDQADRQWTLEAERLDRSKTLRRKEILNRAALCVFA